MLQTEHPAERYYTAKQREEQRQKGEELKKRVQKRIEDKKKQ
jgi:hypothetical protein